MSLQAIVILSVVFALAIPKWSKPIWGIYQTIFSWLGKIVLQFITGILKIAQTVTQQFLKLLGVMLQQIFQALVALVKGLGELLIALLKGVFTVLTLLFEFIKSRFKK